MTLQEQMVVRTMAQVFDAIIVDEVRWDEPCAEQICELCDHAHESDCLTAAGVDAGLVDVEASWVDAKESALTATW